MRWLLWEYCHEVVAMKWLLWRKEACYENEVGVCYGDGWLLL